MNLIINSSPKPIHQTIGGILSERLAKRLGGPVHVIDIYNSDQKYFNYTYHQEWIDLVIKAKSFILPVPMWNFTIPAALKDFLDKISQKEKVWSANSKGKTIGLLKDRPTYIIMTSGNFYPEGSLEDFLVPYLRTVFSFMVIRQVKDFRLGGVKRSESFLNDKKYLDEKATDMLKTFHLYSSSRIQWIA